MARGFLLKNNFTKETLLKIADIGLLTITVSSPYFLHRLVRNYFKDKNKNLLRKRARKLRDLQKKKIIEFQELLDGDIKVILTHSGKELIKQYKLEDIKIKKPNKWDEYWRIIMYDIPVYKRKACDAFREKMKKMGLYQLQKSVWVSPYDCRPELEFLCSIFEINLDEYFHYFKTKEIPKERELLQFFNL